MTVVQIHIRSIFAAYWLSTSQSPGSTTWNSYPFKVFKSTNRSNIRPTSFKQITAKSRKLVKPKKVPARIARKTLSNGSKLISVLTLFSHEHSRAASRKLFIHSPNAILKMILNFPGCIALDIGHPSFHVSQFSFTFSTVHMDCFRIRYDTISNEYG